jgi:hypothetical protein
MKNASSCVEDSFSRDRSWLGDLRGEEAMSGMYRSKKMRVDKSEDNSHS